jgi:hypothetical protein
LIKNDDDSLQGGRIFESVMHRPSSGEGAKTLKSVFSIVGEFLGFDIHPSSFLSYLLISALMLLDYSRIDLMKKFKTKKNAYSY